MRQAGTPISASELLELERAGADEFRSLHNKANHAMSLFGGQALAQALRAAMQTVADWPAHHLSGYFLRGGTPHETVNYRVDRLRDGRRFAARRVNASQSGRTIFEMLCAFHDPERGLSHAVPPPTGPPRPETLPSLAEYVTAHAGRLPEEVVEIYRRPFPVEVRLFEPERVFFDRLDAPIRHFWFRVPSADGVESPADQQCLLAFASDYWLAGVAAGAHRPAITGDGFSISSLNHNLWFHAPVRCEQWLLYATDGPWAGEGRGLGRGFIYDRDGRLIATSVQEALMRLPEGQV